MVEFEFDGHNYRTVRKLDVFSQNNIVRRLLPAVGGIAAALAGSGNATDAASFAREAGEQFLANIMPITKALAEMTDADSDYVFAKCLSVVMRQNPGGTGWSAVMTPDGRMMFEDIDLAGLYFIVWKVIEENLASFFSSIGQLLPQQPAAPTAELNG